MTVVITGASGSIGSTLARALLKDQGISEIWNFDVRPLSHPDPRIKNAIADLRDDRELDQYKDLFQRADYVYHVAGVTNRNSLRQFIDFNVRPTKLLLERVRGGKIKRFLFVSSSAVAKPADALGKPTREDEALSPVEAYGESKRLGEMHVRRSGVPYVIVRPSSVYGPSDPGYRQVFDMVSQGMHIYPSHQYFSAIHVDDLVQGMIFAATHKSAENRTYFLAQDEELRWKSVYEIVERLLGTKRKITWTVPYPVAATVALFGTIFGTFTRTHSLINRQKVKLSRPQFLTCSSEAAYRDFGFKAQKTLEQGLIETYKHLIDTGYLKENKDLAAKT